VRDSGELPPFESIHEQAQRAIEDGGDVPVWNRVSQEILGAATTRIDFGEELDQVRRRGALGPDGAAQLHQQIVVRKIGEKRACSRHDPL
jgi:hypothetical protein